MKRLDTVLVVDDSAIILAAVAETLQDAGFQVTTCDNPMLVASELRRGKPDAMLLDVDMPAVKGNEVVAALRKSDCLGDTKVVLYSAMSDPQELSALAAKCGAIGSIPKLVTGPALAARLREVVGAMKTSGTSRFALERALVIARPKLEASLTKLLGQLGVGVTSRGAVGVDRALREGGRQFAILDESAFAGNLDIVLERLENRGLLGGVAALVIGNSDRAHCLSAALLNKHSLLAAMKVAAGEANGVAQ